MEFVTFSTPLSELPGIPPRSLKLLGRMGLTTAGDLLHHFPARYEDYSVLTAIEDASAGQHATIRGVIESVEAKHTWKRRMSITEAMITDDSGSIKAVWFNQPYMKNALKVGRQANFSGKVSANEKELYLSHPTFELVSHLARRQVGQAPRTSDTIHTGRLVPVYPETKGLTSRGLRAFVQMVLEHFEPPVEWLPDEVLRRHNFPRLALAFHSVHFPESIEEALRAKKRFAFEDLFLLQLYNSQERLLLAKEKAPSLAFADQDLRAVLDSLPFELTPSQKTSLDDILGDLGRGKPMSRLLQGDVGSGKTIVAVIAALVASRNGCQTAFMAPTEILARQHFESVKKVLSSLPHPPIVGFIAAGGAKIFYGEKLEEEAVRSNFHETVRAGKISIIIGTHALIQKSLAFKNLGLVVVDEQHRFGVKQRDVLLKKTGLVPHFLSMSATPIPRTLMLTIFGDLDLSLITELPRGRKPIVTKIVAPENRVKAYGFIKGQVRKGRQAFVICPRIEKTESDEGETRKIPRAWAAMEVKTVKEEYEKLSKRIFPEFTIAMLHGKLKAAEKEKTMREFKDGKINILVSTSVVEVGVDIPNASLMMIEGADRFGLAQLYQFRGRVGRGEHQSFCFLFTDSPYKSTQERLKAVVEAKNGFELAEADLKLRGPGEFLGAKQTGLPDIAMRGLQDAELIRASHDSALEATQSGIFEKNPALQKKLEEFKRKIHRE